ERCHEQGSYHTTRLEARHRGADNPHHGRHEIAEGGRIDAVRALDEVSPDEQEHRPKRNADGGSVRRRAKLPDEHLNRQANAEEESGGSADQKKGADIPAPFTRKKAPPQGYPQEERGNDCRGYPEAPAPFTVVRFCVHWTMSNRLLCATKYLCKAKP